MREESFSQGVARLFSDRAPSEGDQRRCKNSTPLPLPGSLTTNGEGNYVLKVIRILPYVSRPEHCGAERYTGACVCVCYVYVYVSFVSVFVNG